METISKLGAFFGMLFQVLTSKKFREKVAKQIDSKELQAVMDREDKSDLVDEFIQFVNNGCRIVAQTTKHISRLKKVVSDISLEKTARLNTRDFFKIKAEGGIFSFVDNDIFNWLETEIKNSPAKTLASYEFTEDITEEDIIGDAKSAGIYEETNMAHVKQICERHITEGENLLSEKKSNLFWIRDKKGDLCLVYVWLDVGGWRVFVSMFYPSYRWLAGSRSFFRN